jgi:hypothetical protein
MVDPLQTVRKPIFFAPAKARALRIAKARNTRHRVENPSESTLLDCVFSHHKGWNSCVFWYHCVATTYLSAEDSHHRRRTSSAFFFYEESLAVLETID